MKETAQELEHDITRLRDGMTRITRELDVRRHHLFDWKLQLMQHRQAVLIAAGSALLLAAGTVALTRWAKARRERPLNRMKRVWEAAAVKPSPSIGQKLLGAAASAVLGVAAKAIAERVFAPLKGAERAADGSVALPARPRVPERA